MAGIRVRYFTDADGKARVRISGKNGEPMFTSEAYEREADARHAIVVLQDAFQMGRVDYDTDPDEQPVPQVAEAQDVGADDVAGVGDVLGGGDGGQDVGGES